MTAVGQHHDVHFFLILFFSLFNRGKFRVYRARILKESILNEGFLGLRSQSSTVATLTTLFEIDGSRVSGDTV